ncbi:MAG TPA: LLM class flavin-dependent oxidoreductase [Steroidobacteraceae bacterium]|nr:LLM class flavin-dependent oxidoreductase [Steroidobacteraceae bacterium]
MTKDHPLKGPQPFKLGIFSSNASGGLALTTVPERWRASWDDCLTSAQIADRAGFDFILPIARWRGFGGETRPREWSFETFTWAAGLAAATERIGLFMTVHIPLVHPLYAAKALASVDHISHGRAGLNIVCGWNPDEFAMFGVSLAEDLYARAAEWLEIVERAYGATGPFDYTGQFFNLHGVVSRPASIQVPRPVVMNAAFGATGRDFAARNCDFLFSTFADMVDGRRHVADIRARAEALGRRVGIYTVCHVVCRETQAEAEEYYRHYAVDFADHGAVDYHMSRKKEFAHSHDERTFAEYRQRFAGGAGTYPLIGTPERIAEDLAKISAEGYEGTALSFVNYSYELPFFCDRVLPLLRQAGLRVERTL